VFFIKPFKRVIPLFGEFEIHKIKMSCMDEEIKKKLKFRNIEKVFQITKII